MKNYHVTVLLCVLFSLSAASPAFSQNEHPLKKYFQAEILTEKELKEVKIKLELTFHSSPEFVEAEIYHTDLEKELIGLIVEVENKAKDLKYDLLIQMKVPPYENVTGTQYLHRADDLKEGEGTTVKVKEVRYIELPDIDDMVTEAKEEEEEKKDE
jgi:hypothetical protein